MESFAVFEPIANGFKIPAEAVLVDKAPLLTLTALQMSSTPRLAKGGTCEHSVRHH